MKLLTIIIPFLIAACDDPTSYPTIAERESARLRNSIDRFPIHYAKDLNADLCYAIIYANSVEFTNVPCEKIESRHLIEAYFPKTH